MSDLKDTMHKAKYTKFTEDGFLLVAEAMCVEGGPFKHGATESVFRYRSVTRYCHEVDCNR